ncbi:MAG: TetM/TetW/TetO/TetS family tetracycline resistance ribosomal protection protein [Treponema sp.]|uniref:translation factor GTPase family protein n=1 Tax=Treponema sp. TaxID=166 RepID=UPI00298E2519|nr:translation factor GTPase family protein [Treponema sp.]MCQ2600435.1 TetM/TetW/TetO/TetS family tetracycline resistance ribosomal protection protein [Treponema sp.]
MAKLITGILAHVDAGKTTLSEALLYHCGTIRSLGRVDSKNAFLDNNSIEKERGITIFSKQAELNEKITLIDTPGHVDFAAEMERTLSVLDAAILLINASDGIQSHTKTLWSLLNQYKIPAVIFVNKMDMPDTNKETILSKLRSGLSEKICEFKKENLENFDDSFLEEISSHDDSLTEKYLNGEKILKNDICSAVADRNIFPCVFGSALKLDNVDLLFEVLNAYFSVPNYSFDQNDFGCIVYKVSKDKQNNRLTHLKVTGGVLKVKDNLDEEKVNELRLYSGEKYESIHETKAGEICTVTGLKNSYPGKTYGSAKSLGIAKIEPALIYSVQHPQEIDTPKMLGIMRELEEELPEIMVEFSDATKEIRVRLMGEIQTEVIQQIILDRYKIKIDFGEGKIAYKETIAEPVIGVGHYEPLRHYAEVHLKLSPLPRGSGMKFISNLSVDELDTNWQRLIMQHLKEKTHLGVLTGSPITDMEIKVVAGRAHLKHTEGGDFRQSTYRAIRHGLMYAKSILLEPMYSYEIVVPELCTGRVMSDMEKMKGTCTLTESAAGFSILTGKVPVATVKNYINEVRAFTKGQGTLSLTLSGYEECHNEKEVIKEINYDPNADLENPSGSVFCSHGAGFAVNWDKVNDYKHIK